MIADCMKNQVLKKQAEKIGDNRHSLSVILQVLFFQTASGTEAMIPHRYLPEG